MDLRLVVGLGNPGQKYFGTRHNVGRDFIDHLASQENAKFKERGQAETFRLASSVFGREVTFAKLASYMNTSGPAMQSLFATERFQIGETLVISDEFMLPFGSLRLRSEGSAGGHNGLKSVIAAFGTQEFCRLRVGVGPVPPVVDAADFVLDRFAAEERAKMPDLYAAMAGALKTLFSDGIEKAMTLANKAHL